MIYLVSATAILTRRGNQIDYCHLYNAFLHSASVYRDAFQFYLQP
jgi:hypothetical protein